MKELKVKSNLVAVAYARYSSNNQREESIDAQLRAIDEYCERNGVKLIETYSDEAITGKTDDRDDFQKMINDIIKGRLIVDVVLVHKFNRFARNKFDSAIYKKKLKDIGVKVVSVTQNIDDTPEGALMESFLEAMDEYYSANLALEVKKGLRENALKGKHTGGKPLFGYTPNEDGFLVPNDDAKIVKRIFTEFANGVPKSQICERLNSEGLTNQYGRPFKVRSVQGILKNEKYIGNYVYKLPGEVIRQDGAIPAIIDFDLWQRVQEGNTRRLKPRYRTGVIYHLTGKAVCGHCGNTISGSNSKYNKDGTVIRYYRCVGKTSHRNGCHSNGINKKWIENEVLTAVNNFTMDEEKINHIAALAYDEIKKEIASPTFNIDELRTEEKLLKEQQNKLLDLYISGFMEREILDKKADEIKERLAVLENQIKKLLAAAESNDITVNEISEFLREYLLALNTIQDNDDDYKRAIFNAFVERVTVTNDEVIIDIKANFKDVSGGCGKRNVAGALLLLTQLQFTEVIARPKAFSKLYCHY